MLTAAVALTLAGCTGQSKQPQPTGPTLAPPGSNVQAGVPVPVRGFYWGGTNNNDRSTVPGCPSPSTYSGEGGQYGGLECKIAWAAGKLNLAVPAARAADGRFHTTLARAYLNGDFGCRDDQQRLEPGGDIYELASAPGRRALMLSTKCGSWASLADGGGRSEQDTDLRQVVGRLEKLPVPVILIFHHEPEDDACGNGSAAGTPDQFRRAYRQFASTVRSQDARDGRANVSTGWVLMNQTYIAARDGDRAPFTGCRGWRPNNTSTKNPLRNPENWYPGDDAVDWLGADVYTHGTDKPLREAVEPFTSWADAGCPTHHPDRDWTCGRARATKPLALAEMGVGLAKREFSQAEKAMWFDELRSDLNNRQVAQFRRIKAFAYWSSGKQNVIDMPPDPAHPALLAYTRLTLQPLVANPVLPASPSPQVSPRR